MKQDKFIINSERTIENFTTINKIDLSSTHPFVVEEAEDSFIVVKEFSNEAKSASNVVLQNQNENESTINDNLIYAEEIIEDDDNDLYDEGFHDKAIEKQRHRSYLEISQEIDSALEKNGFSGHSSFGLLTAMKFSRLLYTPKSDNVDLFVRSLVTTMGAPLYEISYEEGCNIASNNDIYTIFASAKKSLNKPVFIYVGVLNASNVMEHLRPIYPYIDNPDGDNFVTANGHSMKVPNNIYIIYSLDDDKEFYNVSRRLLRYTARFELDLTQNKVSSGATVSPFILTLEELSASFREANEKYAIEEEPWRKIDELVKVINSVNGYSIKNKIQRRLEDSMIILLSSGKQLDDILDIVLSQFILHEAIISMNPEKYTNEVDLIDSIEDIFGSSGMKRSKNVIKEYLTLFTKKGKK